MSNEAVVSCQKDLVANLLNVVSKALNETDIPDTASFNTVLSFVSNITRGIAQGSALHPDENDPLVNPTPRLAESIPKASSTARATRVARTGAGSERPYNKDKSPNLEIKVQK